MNRLRINNYRFTIRFCTVARTYGFKTIGKFEKFLNGLESPHVKLYFGTTYMRASRLIRELEEFKKSY
jgi:hypothetical protein